jgi:hypothetical protein
MNIKIAKQILSKRRSFITTSYFYSTQKSSSVAEMLNLKIDRALIHEAIKVKVGTSK